MCLLKKRLLHLRKNFDLTQTDLANYLHISRSTYINYENGSRYPNVPILIKLSRLYRVPISYLLDDTSLVEENSLQNYQTYTETHRLSYEELLLLTEFRSLDKTSQSHLLHIVDALKK